MKYNLRVELGVQVQVQVQIPSGHKLNGQSGDTRDSGYEAASD